MSATPGPWKIKGPSRLDPGRSDGGDFAILDSAGKIIAETFNKVGHDEFRPAEANARFIESAWPVSDALLGLLSKLGEANLTPEQCAIVAAACDEASAALIASGRVMG